MDYVLTRGLREINDEERLVLERGKVNLGVYVDGAGGVINYRKMLACGKQMDMRKHTRFAAFPEHGHNFVEMVYMCSGHTTHILNKNRQITLNAGELLLLNQYAVHEILPAGVDDIAINFIIMPEFFDSVVAATEPVENVLRRFLSSGLTKESGGVFLHFKVADALPVQNLMENLVWTFCNETRNERGIRQATMRLLLLNLLNYADKIESPDLGDNIEIKILRYIDEHYVYGSLENLAETLHHDASWLSRDIKRRIGKTYKQLIQEKRVGQAIILLDSTDLGVSEIARRVGYSNISYFHRLFRNMVGCTPREYRNRGALPHTPPGP